jgi:phosphatidylinositol-3-phosphatase
VRNQRLGIRFSVAALIGLATLLSSAVVPVAWADSPVLSSVALTPANSSVALGSTLQLTATGTYSDGSTLDVTTQAVWSSSGQSVSVSNALGSEGLASAASIGTATVSATLDGVVGGTGITATPRVYAPGSIQHVIWIMMENHSASTIVGSSAAPYINSLIGQYGLTTNYRNITHPSVPNYLGAVSGQPLSALPITDCTTCKQAGASIFTEGETWKSYQESMPGPCKRVKSLDGLYVPRHNPALYFTSILSATCKADDLPYTALASDLAQNTLPAFSLITPNLIHDMHNGSVTGSIPAGDGWLANNLPPILASQAYRSGTVAIFVTWDEGSGVGNVRGVDCINGPANPSCEVALLVVSQYTTPGTVATAAYDHYSMLLATDELLSLQPLGEAALAPDLAPAFGL